MTKGIKFRCAIYMGDHGVNIYSNYSKTFNILRKGSFVAFIPEYRCVETKARSDYSIVYIQDNASSTRMLDKQTLEIKGPVEEILEASTIPFRAHYMLEPQRQENSIFTVQGAGIAKKGRTVFLMGKRGSGKSSITLELCRRHGYNLIGNDLVLIGLKEDKGYLFGGTKVFPLRLTSVKHYNTDLKRYFNKRRNIDEWTNKTNIYPKELGISVEKKTLEVVKAYYIHLDNNKTAPLYLRKIGDKETAYMGRLFLYEELSRYIRGVCTPVVVGSQFQIAGYAPSLDTLRYHNNRIRLIDWLVDKLGFYYLSGSMNEICGYINSVI